MMNAMYKWPEAQIDAGDATRICMWYESIDEHASGSVSVTARQVPDMPGTILVRIAYVATDNGRHYIADIAVLADGRLELWAN